MSDFDWAVGFIEGEGSFGYYSQTLRVSASQKSLWPLERLQELFGGSIGPLRKDGSCSWWWVTGKSAHKLMLELRPHMSPRRQAQIDQCLEGRVSGKTNAKTLILST